ncbi:MAG: NAD(+) diphosphatase [Dehalococcoidia bacterium]
MTDTMPSTRPMPFSANPLDRASNQRGDDAWLQEQRMSPNSRYLLLWKLNVLLTPDETRLAWLDGSRVPATWMPQPVLLGVQDGIAHYAVDVSAMDDPFHELELEGVRWGEARAIATELPVPEAGIVAQARSLLDWHARHGFCPACGARTVPGKGGSMRRCDECSAQHFPRTDPVAIMLVYNGDRALLGRRAGRAGIFSTVAGFIEQGETIEDAVRREVMEEIGVTVDDVTYISSQPWPFPSSLMIGCFAHTDDTEAHVDEEEIAEARWFSRDELRAAMAGEPTDFGIPGPVAIAHHLIAKWCEQTDQRG